MIFFNKIFTITPSYKKRQPTDVLTEKFKKAFVFTAAWEGRWDGGNGKVSPPFADDVAAYGITPLFLKDHVGKPDNQITLAFMKSIDYDKAANIWFASRWTWYKCENIACDEIALLVFDWAVGRPKAVAEKIAAVVGLSKGQGTENIKYRILGGNPEGKEDGAFYPIDAP